MKIYLAGLGASIKPEIVIPFVRDNYQDIGALCTFAQPREFFKLKEFDFHTIMLDSGAYSAYTRNKKIDIYKLIDFIKENKDYIEISVVLDVIGDAEESYKNWKIMTNNLSVPIMPVFHYGDDYKFLQIYANHTDFIGIGGLAILNGKSTILSSFLDNVCNSYPNHKFHIFGINSPAILNGKNIYSCDATTWLGGSRFAKLVTRYGAFSIREHRSDIWEFLNKEYNIKKEDIILEEKKINYSELLKVNIAETYIMLNGINKYSHVKSLSIF